MKRLFPILLSLAALFVSCEKARVITPEELENDRNKKVVDFSYSINGQTVTFTNKSETRVMVFWDFGDGQTSGETNPTHKYSKDGTYTVKLDGLWIYVDDPLTLNFKTIQKTITINTGGGGGGEQPTYTKLFIYGIKYIDVDVAYDYYKAKLVDDDVFTTTWWHTNFTDIFLYSDKLPYTYTFNAPVEMSGLNEDNYYTLYVYHSTWYEGTEEIQCLKQNIQTSTFKDAIKNAKPYIQVQNNSGNTVVQLLCSYE